MPIKDDAALDDDAHGCRGLNATVTVRTTSTDEFAEYPEWMRFMLTDEVITELLRLRSLCRIHGLEDASTYHFCEVGSTSGSSERCRTDLERLRVYDGGFFVFEAKIKNTDMHFESIPMFFDDFFADVSAGRRFIATEGRDDAEDAEFQELVAENEAEIAGDDNAAAA